VLEYYLFALEDDDAAVITAYLSSPNPHLPTKCTLLVFILLRELSKHNHGRRVDDSPITNMIVSDDVAPLVNFMCTVLPQRRPEASAVDISGEGSRMGR